MSEEAKVLTNPCPQPECWNQVQIRALLAAHSEAAQEEGKNYDSDDEEQEALMLEAQVNMIPSSTLFDYGRMMLANQCQSIHEPLPAVF